MSSESLRKNVFQVDDLTITETLPIIKIVMTSICNDT